MDPIDKKQNDCGTSTGLFHEFEYKLANFRAAEKLEAACFVYTFYKDIKLLL